MTELKTLKDIEEIGAEAHKITGSCYKKDIRVEAVKWVKNCGCSLSEHFKHDCSRCSFIMHFFNLTEEDLK